MRRGGAGIEGRWYEAERPYIRPYTQEYGQTSRAPAMVLAAGEVGTCMVRGGAASRRGRCRS
jgi:hypothetical protein